MTDTTAPAEPGMEEYAAMRAKGSVTPQLAKFAAAAPPVEAAAEAETVPEPEATPEVEAAAAPETEAATEATPPPAPKRNGINERLSDMASRRDAAEARADRAVERAEKIAADFAAAVASLQALNPPPATPAPAKVELEPRPNRASFDDPDAYETAFEGWVTRNATASALAEVTRREAETKAEADRQAQERAAAQQRAALERSWAEKAAAAAEKHEDFTETIYSDDVQISRPMMQIIMTLENGADIAGANAPVSLLCIGEPFAEV